MMEITLIFIIKKYSKMKQEKFQEENKALFIFSVFHTRKVFIYLYSSKANGHLNLDVSLKE